MNKCNLLIIFLLCFFNKAYALGRTHEYFITVVNSKNEPRSNIIVKTESVKGYDQNSASCITSSDGSCSLKFSAFAPREPAVTVTLDDNSESGNKSPAIILPPVKNSFFKNDDSINVNLVYDPEAIQLKKRARLDSEKRWELNKGPNLSEFSISEPVFISKYLNDKLSSKSSNLTRGKFESEEEFNNRAKKFASNLYYFDLPVDDTSKCTSNFSHSESVYKIKCKINSKTQPFFEFHEEGSSFVLSNAYDKREIKREIINSVHLPFDLEWSAEIKIDREAAKLLDADLAIGFLHDGPVDVTSSCGLCESRDRQDGSAKTIENLNSLSESLSALTGRRSSYTAPPKGWKDDAFREGRVIEDWKRTINVNSLKSIIIFRKSNKQVLFKLDQK